MASSDRIQSPTTADCFYQRVKFTQVLTEVILTTIIFTDFHNQILLLFNNTPSSFVRSLISIISPSPSTSRISFSPSRMLCLFDARFHEKRVSFVFKPLCIDISANRFCLHRHNQQTDSVCIIDKSAPNSAPSSCCSHDCVTLHLYARWYLQLCCMVSVLMIYLNRCNRSQSPPETIVRPQYIYTE